MTDTEITYRLRPEVKADWLAALRSGKYQQGTCYLCREENRTARFCCLGVLCELAVEAGVVQRSVSTEWVGRRVFYDYGASPSHTLPPQEVLDWAFEGPPPDRIKFHWTVPIIKYGEDDPTQADLADVNDGYRYAFPRIADLIEAAL